MLVGEKSDQAETTISDEKGHRVAANVSAMGRQLWKPHARKTAEDRRQPST